MPLDFPLFAPNRLHLIVEDALTRDYLQAVWAASATPKIQLGGNNDGVRAVVSLFEREGHTNVFGLTDQDFRPSNRQEWENPQKTFRTFVLPVHEVENYLLDAQALHASPFHNRGLSVDAIEQRMVDKARSLCWWAACRDVIAELKRRFREPFIPDPAQSLASESESGDHIFESVWFKKLPTEVSRSSRDEIRKRLQAEYQAALARIQDGSWRQDFAGKEILRDVAGWMCDRSRIVKFPKSDAVFYSDLAKQIGKFQVETGTVPPDLTDLLKALQGRFARASLAPP